MLDHVPLQLGRGDVYSRYQFYWVPQSLEYCQSHLPKMLWTGFLTLSRSAGGTFRCLRRNYLRALLGKGAEALGGLGTFCWGSQSHRWHLNFKKKTCCITNCNETKNKIYIFLYNWILSNHIALFILVGIRLIDNIDISKFAHGYTNYKE